MAKIKEKVLLITGSKCPRYDRPHKHRLHKCEGSLLKNTHTKLPKYSFHLVFSDDGSFFHRLLFFYQERFLFLFLFYYIITILSIIIIITIIIIIFIIFYLFIIISRIIILSLIILQFNLPIRLNKTEARNRKCSPIPLI